MPPKSYVILTCGRTDGVAGNHPESKLIGEPLTEEDQPMKDWMVKLGAAVKFNLSLENDDKDYAMRIPDGYTLRTKKFESKDGTIRERADYMMYGHPTNPSLKEGFRSPAEFAPHLLWLLSGSDDYQHCSCKKCEAHCASVTKKTGVPTGAAGVGSVSAVGTDGDSGSDGTQLTRTASAQRHAANLVSSNSPAAMSTAALAKLGGGTDLFRKGELVWYQHLAWRLGIIREIKYGGDGSEVQFVRIAPLSHVSLKAQDVVNPEVMRPFLSFSVPVGGKGFESMAYEQVDWNQLAERYLSRPDLNPESLGLEASKMAARMIGWSFSLFNRIPTPAGSPSSWGGCFAGAELIFTGDALRVTHPAGEDSSNPNEFDVMALAAITKEGAKLTFSGDVYRLTKSTTGTPTAANPPGAVFAHEINMRNRITASHGVTWSWVLVEANGVRTEEQMWGRFYVTDALMRAIEPATFEDEVSRGEVGDAGRFLNYRLQPPVHHYVGQKANRMAMLGSSVSSAIVLGKEIHEEDVLLVD